MASWKTIQKILEKLSEEGLTPEYSDPNFHLKLDWEQMPEGVDPSSGFLKEKRLRGKRWQVENCIQLSELLLKGGEVIVDFCSGSGHLSIPMAYRFPDCHFILVERNPVPVEIGNKRVKDSGLTNIEFCNSYIQDFQRDFDMGIALHACGEATDLAHIKCLEKDAAYVMCPCDIGFLQNSKLDYPRSLAFSQILTREEYMRIASAGDWTCWDFDSDQGKRGKLCMGYISLDRNLAAEEAGYRTHLFTTNPREATPKNDIIFGYKAELSITL
jgi:methyltransferase family protein